MSFEINRDASTFSTNDKGIVNKQLELRHIFN